MPYIKTSHQNASEANLYYEDLGSGKPVILIHGWPSSHEMWEYQLNELPRNGIRCIAYDRRGFGKSCKTWDGYDYNSLAADLKTIIDELDLKNVTLVGFSMGGGEVIRYLTNYGKERISKAVLISSIIPFMLKTEDNPDGIDKMMFDKFYSDIEDDRPAFLTGFGKQFFGENFMNHPVSQHFLDWAHMLTLQGSSRATLECLRSFSETDFRNELLNLVLPFLIIHGDEDKTVPIELSSKKTSLLLQNAVYKIYENAPHGLFYTEKNKLNADLVSFIV